MEEGELIRSKASLFHVLVLFVNKTDRIVNLYWLDYDGVPRKILTLNPGNQKRANTFLSHPWVFRDSLTGERMCVENKCVYWPKPLIIYDHIQNHRIIKRKQIDIHFPMRTLRDNCLWAIVKCIKNSETVYSFELPKVLTSELINVFSENKKHENDSQS